MWKKKPCGGHRLRGSAGKKTEDSGRQLSCEVGVAETTSFSSKVKKKTTDSTEKSKGLSRVPPE